MSKKVKVHFRNAPDYKKHPATGVWGGVAPTGNVMAEFFVDTTANPDTVDYEVSDEGKQSEVGRAGDREGDVRLILRELQTGVILTPQDAFTVGSWFMQKAVEAGYQPVSPEQDTVQ